MGDTFDKGDPKKLFKLLNKLATGSYGTVFKVRSFPGLSPEADIPPGPAKEVQ